VASIYFELTLIMFYTFLSLDHWHLFANFAINILDLIKNIPILDELDDFFFNVCEFLFTIRAFPFILKCGNISYCKTTIAYYIILNQL